MENNYNLMSAPRYAGIATFMRTPFIRDPSKLDLAIIGVPFDGGVENRAGARHGPREIRNMSSMLRSIHHVTRINPYEMIRIADMGDAQITHQYQLEEAINDIFQFYRKVHAAGVIPLSAGGDHSISYPFLHAIAEDRPV